MLEMPIFEFVGDDYYEAGQLDKVAIDWSKQIIRGSLTVKPEHNHPNIKKKVQRQVVFFKFSDVGKTLRHLTKRPPDVCPSCGSQWTPFHEVLSPNLCSICGTRR